MSPPPASAPFHVFLSHNSKNKDLVRELKEQLTDQGLNVWLDEDELRPGIPWQQLLEAGINDSQSVAVLVGTDGLGPWENEEMRAALLLAVEDKRPVIPVLLPSASQPELPMFLRGRMWVDLRGGLTREGLADLVWGITGVKKGAKKAKRATFPTNNDSGLASGAGARQDVLRAVADRRRPSDSGQEMDPPVAPPPVDLGAILPGGWQIQIQTPFALGQMQLQVFPGGMFHGDLSTPMGLSAVDGQWQANPFTRQIVLQGRQTNGFQVLPYMALVQVTHFDPQQIVGVTNGGEQVLWRRVSPPVSAG